MRQWPHAQAHSFCFPRFTVPTRPCHPLLNPPFPISAPARFFTTLPLPAALLHHARFFPCIPSNRPPPPPLPYAPLVRSDDLTQVRTVSELLLSRHRPGEGFTAILECSHRCSSVYVYLHVLSFVPIHGSAQDGFPVAQRDPRGPDPVSTGFLSSPGRVNRTSVPPKIGRAHV